MANVDPEYGLPLCQFSPKCVQWTLRDVRTNKTNLLVYA